MCSAPSLFLAQAEALWGCVPHLSLHRAPKDSLQVGWKPMGALRAAVSHIKQAPHQLLHPTARDSAPLSAPRAPLLRARDDVPQGAALGSALLAHWQDFAAVCSEPVVLVTEETCRKQHCWWTGLDRALGRGEAGLGKVMLCSPLR